jgi:predicted DNA repair protein MutK
VASGFFALFDDISVLMDDVATMGKVAAKKTAGILGDDLAVNAEKASGFVSSRELPVLWAITKGSFVNKMIILPIAFLLSAFMPWMIVPILLIGGLYLAFEGTEKIYEFFVPHEKAKQIRYEAMSKEEILSEEKEKIKSAIVTDFILSIEIVIIALGSVVGEPLVVQIVIVTLIAFLATIGVYGIVAMIVRMDDFGLKLIEIDQGRKSVLYKLGEFLIWALPKVIKSLGVIGTLAMLLVAGGIFMHNIHYIHDALHSIPSIAAELLVGLFVGIVVLVIEKGIHHLRHQ